jgi:predicted RNA-binding protein YlqC (UPF0109 family)
LSATSGRRTSTAAKRIVAGFMRETIEMIVKALVDDADAVDVREIERNGMTRIEIRVAQPDMGKVIGKQGRTVRALRSLVYAAGVKQHRRFALDIVE